MKTLIGALLCLTATLTHANHDSTEWIDAPHVQIRISELKPGEMMTVNWADYPVSILKPTKNQLAEYRSIKGQQLGAPYPAMDIGNQLNDLPYNSAEKIIFAYKMLEQRFQQDISVFINISPYIGCSTQFKTSNDPKYQLNNYLYDPCEDVHFDISGRVLLGHKHQTQENLELPPYTIDGDVITIGNTLDVKNSDVKQLLSTIDKRPIKTEEDFFHAIGYGHIEQIKKYIANNDVDLSKEIKGKYIKSPPFSKAIMLKHYEVAKVVNYKEAFDWVAPSGVALGCTMQYFSDDDLEALFSLGLDPNKAYCNYEYNGCKTPIVFHSPTEYGDKEAELPRLAQHINNGYNLSNRHCGKTLEEKLSEDGYAHWYSELLRRIKK
ncbi:hypothetical protein [Kangiella taiwanensis]|uniref:Uncharacterized protein n=1 Tax=Kangiella taiwanensis TaxID=1079179 RepID=A0ABP8HQ16_9GAMM|nr:hypothetical protein [Kangiella taiwanensis]